MAEDPVALARAHRAAGHLEKAETVLKRHLRAHPQDARSLHLLGMVARDKGRPERAVQLLEKAAAAAPAAPDIRCDLGLALKAAGRHDDAVTAQARVVELLPDSALAWSNHGTALAAAGRPEEAVASLTRALELEPASAEIHFNLGNARLALGDAAAAEAAFRRTLEQAPHHAGALENLSCALKEQGRLAEAEDLLHGACALHPDNADLRWNHALALLMAGEYEQGWAAYEARRAIPGFAMRPPPLPPWDGGALAPRRLLVHTEQGLGDTLQFCRYVERLDGEDGEVVFQVPSRLVPLMRTLATRAQITDSAKAANRCDVEAPLLSLPHLCGPAAPFWPAGGAYLKSEPDRLARWKKRLAGHAGPSIAIAWQGDPGYRADRTRSIPLENFAPFAQLPGVRLISLQQGPGRTQIEKTGWTENLLDLGEEIDRDGAFLDSAAILAVTDLMVSSDTALAHLAGALGVPAYVALSHMPDWRWGAEGEDCPWYPNMRLFRQDRPGDWPGVFRRIAMTIKENPA